MSDIIRKKPRINQLKVGSRIYAEIGDKYAIAIVLEADHKNDHFRLHIFNFDKDKNLIQEWSKAWKAKDFRRVMDQVTYFIK